MPPKTSPTIGRLVDCATAENGAPTPAQANKVTKSRRLSPRALSHRVTVPAFRPWVPDCLDYRGSELLHQPGLPRRFSRRICSRSGLLRRRKRPQHVLDLSELHGRLVRKSACRFLNERQRLRRRPLDIPQECLGDTLFCFWHLPLPQSELQGSDSCPGRSISCRTHQSSLVAIACCHTRER
jgi:hypothetical protein